MNKPEKKERKMLTETVIRAADYLPKEDAGDPDSFQMTQSDKILFGIFGDTPDYSKPKIEELWKEFHKAEPKDLIAYCLEMGIDILQDDGDTVPGHIDIAVMLKAIEKGILKLDK